MATRRPLVLLDDRTVGELPAADVLPMPMLDYMDPGTTSTEDLIEAMIDAGWMRQAAGGGGGATTWDALVAGSGIVLSNSNLDASIASGAAWKSVLGTNGKASGRWQFEIILVSGGSAFAAIADKSDIALMLSTYVGNYTSAIEGVGYWGNGIVYRCLSSGTGSVSAGAWDTTNIITVALDLSSATNTVKFYRDGVLQNTTNIPSGKTWFPATTVENSKKTRLIPAGLTYPVAGYTEWG